LHRRLEELAAAEELHVCRAVGEVRQGVDRLPDAEVEISRASSKAEMPVALPLSSWSRQTNPGLASASALIDARFDRKSSILGSSMGARRRPTFSCATCTPPWCRTVADPSGSGRRTTGGRRLHRDDPPLHPPAWQSRGNEPSDRARLSPRRGATAAWRGSNLLAEGRRGRTTTPGPFVPPSRSPGGFRPARRACRITGQSAATAITGRLTAPVIPTGSGCPGWLSPRAYGRIV